MAGRSLFLYAALLVLLLAAQASAQMDVKDHPLVSKYRVSAARLDAAGVGPLAPVATNETEDGRAKNRRVEWVKQ